MRPDRWGGIQAPAPVGFVSPFPDRPWCSARGVVRSRRDRRSTPAPGRDSRASAGGRRGALFRIATALLLLVS